MLKQDNGIHFSFYSFSALSVSQLYAILSLRADVFVVEQKCPYLDPDGQDPFALHLLGLENGSLVAYARLFPPTETQSDLVFGRVVTAQSARAHGYGKKLIQELLQYCNMHFPGVSLQGSAQFYLKKFYEGLGFQAYGEVYEEDGIPHIAMKREVKL